MAQRKLAFHVLGSGSFSPALYRPREQQREEGRQGHVWGGGSTPELSGGHGPAVVTPAGIAG